MAAGDAASCVVDRRWEKQRGEQEREFCNVLCVVAIPKKKARCNTTEGKQTNERSTRKLNNNFYLILSWILEKREKEKKERIGALTKPASEGVREDDDTVFTAVRQMQMGGR